MNTRLLPGSFTLSTALVATMAVVVIAFTGPAEAAPAPVTIHAAPSTAQLRQLAADVQGSYTLADGRSLDVWREAGAMHAQIDGERAVRLQPAGAGRLRTADGRLTFEFIAGPDGRALGVNVAVSPARPR